MFHVEHSVTVNALTFGAGRLLPDEYSCASFLFHVEHVKLQRQEYEVRIQGTPA